ncbi:hypothetical protein [Cohnella massiliensis]|nr:hypothetical protein [Cohnella massiliensis]
MTIKSNSLLPGAAVLLLLLLLSACSPVSEQAGNGEDKAADPCRRLG